MNGGQTEDGSRAPLLGFLTTDLGRGEEVRRDDQSEKSFSHTVRFEDEVGTGPKMRERVVDIDDPKRSRNIMLASVLSHPHDELRYFRNGLRCLGLDQSTKFKVGLSWIVFVLFTFIVPFVNLTHVSCPDCDPQHRHPFEGLVQIAESSLAAVSFLCLSHIVRRHGLRRTLLLDRIVRESVEVRTGYESELHSAFSLLASILLPVATIEIVFRVWWYYYVTVTIPFIEDDRRLSLILNIAFFSSGLLSWLYRTSVFLFTCILFRLMCSLQILRLKGYIKLLGTTPNVSIILTEHMRIRSQLTTISHRFRAFMVLSLFTISFSQVWSLFVLLSSYEKFNFFRAGDLVVCSVVQVTGLMLCLNGASKITHRAQRIIGIVSQWHALATCNPHAVTDSQKNGDDPSQWSTTMRGPAHPHLYNDSSEENDSDEDSPRHSNDVDQYIHDMENFQKRNALVCYLQQAKTGISLYGCVLDRGFLYGMFGCTVSLTLFILGKTIVT
ncbi:hypothetical protein KC19_4G049000 [Ceratodon purpureus]|uniref:Uncharacterized protein n=1 Tax=Ceratodon purpureus TaxID=3225 RepID=A0A8T0I586_CERPU|nr:hypothetical protein KC19_4G049000 [Ceratodon purpureus]